MRIARLIADWLLYCGDPTSRAGPFPPPLPTALAEEELVHRCDLHGILTPLLRRFPFAAARCPRLQAAVKERDRRSQAYSTLLRHLGETVMADAAGLQAAIVKGPVFARALYPSPHLRGFTDIDILAAPEAVPKLETILRAHGFRPAGVPPGPPRHESKWIRD
jgi:hypothetical protein